MSAKKIIKGTLILTTGGVLVRILGFLFKILLKKYTGAVNVGIYEMIMPLPALCHAISVAGFEISVTRFCADRQNRHVVPSCAALSFLLSAAVTVTVFLCSPVIASCIFHNTLCLTPVKIICLSLPFSCIHSMVSAYCIGKDNAIFPVVSQLCEQIVRIVCISTIASKINTASAACISLVAGEFFSAIICILFIRKRKKIFLHPHLKRDYKIIKSMALPIATNRIFLHIIQIVETSLIPMMLCSYGLSSTGALKLYGIIAGMAMPFIMFPATLTNSLAQMLLKSVSSCQNDFVLLNAASKKIFRFSFVFGGICVAFFLIFGHSAASWLFNEESLSGYIQLMAWIIPFMFMASTYKSMLHAVGKTSTVLANSMLSELINMFFIVFLIPRKGINAYILGLIISQCVYSVSNMICFNRYVEKINTPQ